MDEKTGEIVALRQKGDKKGKVELIDEIASAINGDYSPFVRPWPHTYRAFEPSPGVRIPCEVRGEELTVTSKDRLAQQVVAWMRLHNVPKWFVTLAQAREAVDYYLSITTPVAPPDIKYVRWHDEPGLTWRRLPWIYGAGAALTWKAMLGRLSNGEAFMDWLGSLFFDDSSLQNYCWIHGMGHDGKGAINRFLARVFGQSYRSKQPPPMGGDKFWTHGLLGARLVVLPDCNSQTFTTSGLFKSLTGGDPVNVEAKGLMAFTAALACKFLFFSNEKPAISSERADLRRIIYCEFKEAGEFDPLFEDKLWLEGGFFLSTCVDQYRRKYPKHGAIITKIDEIHDVISGVEEEYETLFDTYFHIVSPEYRSAGALKDLSLEQLEMSVVWPVEMQKVLLDRYPSNRAQGQFRAWLERAKGIRKQTLHREVPGRSDEPKAYPGMCLKSKLYRSNKSLVSIGDD